MTRTARSRGPPNPARTATSAPTDRWEDATGADWVTAAPDEGDAREYDALFEVGILTEISEGDYEFAVDEDLSNTVDVDESAFTVDELERLDVLSGDDDEVDGLEATVARGDVDDE
ncbi:MAG: hypothetical protein V5A62_04135 [Haloarculaceae archaeon]